GLGREELARRLGETDPPPPSERLFTATEEAVDIARRRNSDPSRLRREMAGDLDAIVMKAMERDRSRRYGSAAELSADLGGSLEAQPVLARGSGVRSWISRQLRRHRAGIAGAVTVLLVLLQIGFSASLALQLRQATRASTGTGALHAAAGSARSGDEPGRRRYSANPEIDPAAEEKPPRLGPWHVIRD